MSNATTNPYGLDEGRDSIADYHPERLGGADLAAGAAEQTWEEYALEMVPVRLNDTDTGRRLLLRNGEFIADVSKDYKLLPNERAVEAADRAAAELGAVPFDTFGGDWYVTLNDHVFQDPERRRVHALYAWDDPVDVGDGDPIQFGFAVHNAIDASRGFEVGLFTFRHACANMVFMGQSGRGMNFDDREVVVHAHKRHTASLDVDHDELVASIKSILALADDVSDTYRAWHEEFITPDQVETLITRFPATDLPPWAEDIADTLDKAAEEGQVELPNGETLEMNQVSRRRLVAAEMPRLDKWNAYNEMTESIWHSANTSDNTKRSKMKALHAAFPPGAGLR